MGYYGNENFSLERDCIEVCQAALFITTNQDAPFRGYSRMVGEAKSSPVTDITQK